MSKKNKALGIGNAIVDAVCKVNESFLKSHNLQKGTMKLIDNNELKKIQNEIKPSEFIAGGSVANSMVGLSSFGSSVYFFGKINNDEEFKWIIDPIDGTANFLHGIPHFGISIGLEHNKEIICGIIYDPIKDEMFSAEKGNGSYLNNQRMRVSVRSKLKDCIIFTGGPSYEEKDRDKKLALEEYKKFSSKVLIPIRKMGSASLDMAYVAAGRCDGFWQRNLNYWDIAAGIILV